MNAKLIFIKKPTIKDINKKKNKRMNTLDYSNNYSPQKSHQIIKKPSNSPKKYIIKESDVYGNTKVYQLTGDITQ